MEKIELISKLVKQYGIEAGATVIGIAAADDFTLAPVGFKPTDVLEDCRSVIVLGVPFSQETLNMSPPEYTELRNAILTKMTGIANKLAKRITKESGHKCKAISAIGGKSVDGKFHGHISLKHAAELSGIGVITRNYLLTSPIHGNLLWLSAVLTDANLMSDEKLKYGICESCNQCVDVCPVDALDNPDLFERKECRKFFVTENKKLMIKCWACRTVCPYRFGEDH